MEKRIIIERYDMQDGDLDTGASMLPNRDGDYCEYDDVENIIKESWREVNELRHEIESLKAKFKDIHDIIYPEL